MSQATYRTTAISAHVCWLFSTLSILAAPQGVWAQNQLATTVQLPTFGISIDTDGVLRQQKHEDAAGNLMKRRREAAQSSLPTDVAAWSETRKVSLVRLEKAIRDTVSSGDAPDTTMRHLAGLQRVQYAFCYPHRGDIVIAGPAEGWVDDLSGRAVGIGTGRPVVLLEDLIVALRAHAAGRPPQPFFGCTIDPDPVGLARLNEFNAKIPRFVPPDQRGTAAELIFVGVRESLGRANIRVFGLPPQTHFARVLIEADYRMKLIGIGVEPPPIHMVTFIGALKRPPSGALQRWWFTPNYECVRVTDDRLAIELVGQGVQLQGEDGVVGPAGRFSRKGSKLSRPAELFTRSFTKKYTEIAAQRPVYAQLRNLIDLLVAAAYIRQQDWHEMVDWRLGVLGNETALPVATGNVPRQVDCAVNVFWKGNRLLAPAGGGISIRPVQALIAERLMSDDNRTVASNYDQSVTPNDLQSWWWD